MVSHNSLIQKYEVVLYKHKSMHYSSFSTVSLEYLEMSPNSKPFMSAWMIIVTDLRPKQILSVLKTLKTTDFKRNQWCRTWIYEYCPPPPIIEFATLLGGRETNFQFPPWGICGFFFIDPCCKYSSLEIFKFWKQNAPKILESVYMEAS